MFENIGKEAVEEINQHVLAWMDRIKEIIEELREDTEIEITIKFRKKA